jgi:hypothetical protein
MMRPCRASAIAALCVLASAATAHAECAWVLSSRNPIAQDSQRPPWTGEGCMTLSKCWAKILEIAGEKEVRRQNPSGVLIRDDTTGAFIELKCEKICDCDGGP